MWYHKTKHRGKRFVGNYEYKKRKGKKIKVFELRRNKTVYEFKSWQEAKKKGWEKLKRGA